MSLMKGESASLSPIRRRPELVRIGLRVGAGCENVVAMPRIGLEFPNRMSFEKWVHVGKVLSAANTSTAWCLGDWLVFGETVYNGRYRDAIEQTSLDYQTLRNYAWVARRFPLSRRRDMLSFGHHAEVAALSEPEQDFWLRKAEALSWSRNRLRAEVKISLRERVQDNNLERDSVQTPDQPGRPDGINGVTASAASEAGTPDETSAAFCQAEWPGLHLKITVEQLERCKAMAAQAGMSVEAWAIRMLDSASRRLM
jgi:hypothetical protein